MSFTAVLFKSLYLFLDILGGGFLDDEVLFESLESKTAKNEPVYNRISFKEKGSMDIWTMKQSHHGIHPHTWDHVQLIVYKDTKPYQVSYHQLKDGKEVEYKASCLRCHSSGPRLIRPKTSNLELNIKEKLSIFKWNQLIKSYGNTILKENAPFKRTVPLSLVKNPKKLNIASCTSCHAEGAIRNTLTSEHTETIKFILKNKEMPPRFHNVTEEDKNELTKFLFQI